MLAEPINAPFSIESAAHSVSPEPPTFPPMLFNIPLLLFDVFSFRPYIENFLIFFPNASFHSSSRSHFVSFSCSIRSFVLLLRVLWPTQKAESITLLALSTDYRSIPLPLPLPPPFIHCSSFYHLREFERLKQRGDFADSLKPSTLERTPLEE